jgi:hypothetical protein
MKCGCPIQLSNPNGMKEDSFSQFKYIEQQAYILYQYIHTMIYKKYNIYVLWAILTEIQIIYYCFNWIFRRKNESLQRYISQIYLSNGKTVSCFFWSPQTCASHSAKYSNDVHFINYTTCLTIIITQMMMTNQNSMTQTNSLRPPCQSKHPVLMQFLTSAFLLHYY